MKNKTKLPFLRTENLVVKELPNELLIYDLENNKAFCLNETARLIMDQCDGNSTIVEAVASINRKLKSKLSEDMVWMVVDQLKKANVVEADYEIPIQINRVSRRKILQTAAGLGIALPIVTSLIAPTAAYSQSGCPGDGQPCIQDQDVACCGDLLCVNTETGPTGFTCVGCIPVGSPCLVGGPACCDGNCVGEPGFTQCSILV